MRRLALVLGATALLAACESGMQTGLVGPAAHDRCLADHLDSESDFRACLDNRIEKDCAGAGHDQNGVAFEQCVRDNHRAAFVRSQLEPLRSISPRL